MESNEKPQNIDVEYQIVTYKKMDDRFQGVVLVTAHAGVPQKPIVEIPTPATFETERAARLEAIALASHLVETGAMLAFLPKKNRSY